MTKRIYCAWLGAALIACGGGSKENGEEPALVTTEHCSFEPVPESANTTGEVSSGALQAGAAESIIDIPISTALGGYTARAGFLGQAGVVDTRDVAIADSFNESIGVESAPRIKVVVLTAAGETIVLVKIDAIFPYEGMTFDVAEELGAAGARHLDIEYHEVDLVGFLQDAKSRLGIGSIHNVVPAETFLELFPEFRIVIDYQDLARHMHLHGIPVVLYPSARQRARKDFIPPTPFYGYALSYLSERTIGTNLTGMRLFLSNPVFVLVIRTSS